MSKMPNINMLLYKLLFKLQLLYSVYGFSIIQAYQK